MEHDIYQISARIKNHAAANDDVFSEQGRALCNMYTHVIKALYDFSDTLEDKSVASRLNDVIRKQETFPSNLLDLFVPQSEPEIDEEEQDALDDLN